MHGKFSCLNSHLPFWQYVLTQTTNSYISSFNTHFVSVEVYLYKPTWTSTLTSRSRSSPVTRIDMEKFPDLANTSHNQIKQHQNFMPYNKHSMSHDDPCDDGDECLIHKKTPAIIELTTNSYISSFNTHFVSVEVYLYKPTWTSTLTSCWIVD